jgi:hypothetical protein
MRTRFSAKSFAGLSLPDYDYAYQPVKTWSGSDDEGLLKPGQAVEWIGLRLDCRPSARAEEDRGHA